MKHKSTLILLAAAIVAGVVAYSLSRKPTSQELSELRRRILPDLRPEEVDALTVQEGKERIVCERDQKGEWRIVEPIRAPADRWAVEAILDRLETAERVSYVRPERGRTLQLAPYGLDEPLRTVTLRAGPPQEREWKVIFGKEAGVAEALFAQVEGQPGVVAVPREVAEKTAVTVAELRSKKLAPRISTLDLQRVEVSAEQAGDEPAFEVACVKADGQWELRRPFHDLADGREVERLADTLYSHRIGADEFVADDPDRAPEHGLDEPSLTVVLGGEEESHKLLFARRDEREEAAWFAMLAGAPTIARVPASLVEALRRGPNELRERVLADFRPDDVARIALDGPAGELSLEKGDDGWRIAGEEPAAADGQVVDDLLSGLREAEISEFVADDPDDLAPYGLGEERRTSLALYDEEGEELATVYLGGPAGDGEDEALYGMRPPYPAAFTLAREDYAEIALGGRLALLDRLVLEEAAGEAARVEVEGERAFTCVYDAKESRWELARPVRGRADTWAVQALVGELSRLRVARFAAEEAADLAPYGLAEPELTARVAYGRDEGAAQRVRTLRVGAPADGGRYAQLEGDPRVFVISDYVADHLAAELASKQIARASELRGMTFHRGELTARFAFDKDALKWTDAEGGDLPEGLAQKVAEAARLLRDFRATSVADYVADYVERGPARYGFNRPYLTVVMEEELVSGKTVVIGDEAEGGGRYAKGPVTDYVYVAATEDVATLAAPLEEAGAE